MKGVKVNREGDMYFFTFESYSTMLQYVATMRPSQIAVVFDGDKVTGSMPVQAYTVRPQNERKTILEDV